MKVLTPMLAAMAALLLAPPALAQGTSAGAVRAALAGCWQMLPSAEMEVLLKDKRRTNSHQRCFDGKLPGTSEWVTCDGIGSVDCWSGEDRYSLSNGRLLLRALDDSQDMNCAVTVSGDNLELADCSARRSAGEDTSLRPVDGGRFERVKS